MCFQVDTTEIHFLIFFLQIADLFPETSILFAGTFSCTVSLSKMVFARANILSHLLTIMHRYRRVYGLVVYERACSSLPVVGCHLLMFR